MSTWRDWSDEALMVEVQKHDNAEAFQELILRFEKPLFNFFRRMGFDRHTAQDKTQDVFWNIYRLRHTYRVQAKFSTYLFRIAHNARVDFFRTFKKWVTLSLNHRSGEEEKTLEDCLEALGEDPSERLVREEEKRKVEKLLERLPRRLREPLVLVALLEKSYQETADILGIPVGTVKSRLNHALHRLKQAKSMVEDR